MKYRVSELLSATDLGAAGTKTIDINIQDPISRIDILFKTYKSKNNMDDYAHKNITKIEIVDGSDVLFSMDGGQAQALGLYDRKCPTMVDGTHLDNNYEAGIYPIDFGRFLWDTELAFDPKKFRNPQLKITWDEDVSDTGADPNEATVIAYCFDEKPVSPVGFLMSKMHWQTLMGADGTYSYVDLPTDYPIRKLLIQGYYSAHEPWNVIEDARLSEDNLKRVVWDWNMERYFLSMKGVWTPIVEEFRGVAGTTGGAGLFLTPTDYWNMVLAIIVGDGYLRVDAWQRGGRVYIFCDAGSPFVQGIITGFLPNHCFEFPFGDQQDLSDWYDVTLKGSVQLRLESGGAGVSGQGAVILQQLRRY